jgi:hypothetical protein
VRFRERSSCLIRSLFSRTKNNLTAGTSVEVSQLPFCHYVLTDFTWSSAISL